MERLPGFRPIVSLVLLDPVVEVDDKLQEVEIRTPVKTSNKTRTLGVALEKIVDANLNLEVNPFIAIGDLSLHGNAI